MSERSRREGPGGVEAVYLVEFSLRVYRLTPYLGFVEHGFAVSGLGWSLGMY